MSFFFLFPFFSATWEWGVPSGEIPSAPLRTSFTFCFIHIRPARETICQQNRAYSNCNIWWEKHLCLSDLITLLLKQSSTTLHCRNVYWKSLLIMICILVIKGFGLPKAAASEKTASADKTMLPGKNLLGEKKLLGDMKSITSLKQSGLSGVFTGQAVSVTSILFFLKCPLCFAIKVF